MDIHHIMVGEASDALTLVFPRRTIELVQRAINEMVSRAEVNAGDQLSALEFNDFLRHLQLRRPWQEEAMRKDGIVPMWEQPDPVPTLDPDPLKGNGKPRLKVVEQREPSDES